MTTRRTPFLPEVPAVDLAAFLTGWQEAFGEEAGKSHALFLIGRGVTVDLLPLLGRLTRRAAARWEPVPRREDRGGLSLDVLISAVSGWTQHGIAAGPVAAWAKMLAGAPEDGSARAAWQALPGTVVGAWTVTPVPVGVGPWAWAAGLTPEEAVACSLAEVQQMAALRGFAAPPPEVAA